MAAPSLTLHGTPLSTAVCRVLTCLFEKDLNFKFVPVDLSKRQQKSPAFLALNPFGQVPAFQHHNLSLFESRSICRYLCDAFPDSGNRGLLPSAADAAARAAVEQWIEAEAQSFNAPSGVIVFNLALAPRMGLNQDMAAVEKNEERLNRVLDVYEKRLGESRFLAGDEFSLADLSHLPNGQYLVDATGKGEMVMGRENVGRWWGEISERPAWKKVLEMQRAPPPPPSSA